MSRPTVPLFDDKMESLDEVDDEILDTLLDCELGACVVVVQEEEGDERDWDGRWWATEALVIVIEELEGSEAKEGKRRGSSTSIFSSILPPTEVVIVDVGPEIKKKGGGS